MKKEKRQVSISRNLWVFDCDSIDILMSDMGITKEALSTTMEGIGFASKKQFEETKKKWFTEEDDEGIGAKKINVKITVQVEEV